MSELHNTMIAISGCLTGICYHDLTVAEQKIADVLLRNGYLEMRAGSVWTSDPTVKKPQERSSSSVADQIASIEAGNVFHR